MVAGLSLNKTTSKNARKRLRLYHNKFQRNYRILLDLVEKDARIYNKVIQAYKLPKQTDSQRHKRSLAIQQALKRAMKPPLQVMEYSLNTLSLMRNLPALSLNNNLMSDIGTGVLLTQAGFDGAQLNVKTNLKSIKDKRLKRLTKKQINLLAYKARQVNVIPLIRKSL